MSPVVTLTPEGQFALLQHGALLKLIFGISPDGSALHPASHSVVCLMVFVLVLVSSLRCL